MIVTVFATSQPWRIQAQTKATGYIMNRAMMKYVSVWLSGVSARIGMKSPDSATPPINCSHFDMRSSVTDSGA